MNAPIASPIRAPLSGELLGPEHAVTVIAALHPMRAGREILRAPAGLSIAEIVALAEALPGAGRVGRALAVSIGADAVPRELWGRVRLKAGTTLVLRAVPLGGGGNLFKTVALLAVAILTAFVAPYLTPILGTLATAVVTAAISIGAGLLINALFPVKADARDGAGQVYGIGGAQNLASRYQPVPLLHGQMRVYPRYAASAWTEFVGDDQYLHLFFLWGSGSIAVSELKIGETPIGAYRDVAVETFEGHVGDLSSTLYPGAVVQQDLNIQIKQVDGFTTRTTSEGTVRWELDIVTPNGLYAQDNDGEGVEHTVGIEIEQSVAGAGAWTAVETLYLTAVTTKPLRRTVGRAVASGRYDIRFRRLTSDFENQPKVTSVTAATALRSFKSGAPIRSRSPITATALRIKATSQLSGIVDSFNGVVTARVKAWNGTIWAPGSQSRNAADQWLHALQGPGNPRPVPNTKIDWDGLLAWRAFCAVNGYAYDRLHTERASVLDVTQDIASAGRAATVFRDGKWSVVFDDPGAPVVQHFTPRNSWEFRWRRSYAKLPDAFRVRFQDRDRGWRDDEVIAYAPGKSALSAVLFEEVEFPGIAERTMAQRQGRYHYAQLFYRPDEYTLSADFEHLICTRGDRVRVTHDVPGWGLASARVQAVEGSVVRLDEAVSMSAGVEYCIRFRAADASSFVRRVNTVPGVRDAVDLFGTGAVPSPGDLAMFGRLDAETVVLRVKAIRPGDDLSAELILVDDAPEIAAAGA